MVSIDLTNLTPNHQACHQRCATDSTTASTPCNWQPGGVSAIKLTARQHQRYSNDCRRHQRCASDSTAASALCNWEHVINTLTTLSQGCDGYNTATAMHDTWHVERGTCKWHAIILMKVAWKWRYVHPWYHPWWRDDGMVIEWCCHQLTECQNNVIASHAYTV